MNKAIVRKARVEDLKSMKEILTTKELGFKYSLEYFKRLIKNDESICLIAEHLSKIIGVVYGEFNKKENWAELIGIAVLKEYRNKGIGSVFLQEFERITRKNNINTIELFAHTDTLSKHIEKHGYKKGDTYVNCIKELK